MPTRDMGVMSTSTQPVGPCHSAAAEVVWVDEGFAAFVQHRSAGLARTAFLLTADRHLAEDLLQATLVKVADRWSRIAVSGDPTPYVRKVMPLPASLRTPARTS
jgi:hypothetical protein